MRLRNIAVLWRQSHVQGFVRNRPEQDGKARDRCERQQPGTPQLRGPTSYELLYIDSLYIGPVEMLRAIHGY